MFVFVMKHYVCLLSQAEEVEQIVSSVTHCHSFHLPLHNVPFLILSSSLPFLSNCSMLCCSSSLHGTVHEEPATYPFCCFPAISHNFLLTFMSHSLHLISCSHIPILLMCVYMSLMLSVILSVSCSLKWKCKVR